MNFRSVKTSGPAMPGLAVALPVSFMPPKGGGPPAPIVEELT
jgi:hypothetical protein